MYIFKLGRYRFFRYRCSNSYMDADTSMWVLIMENSSLLECGVCCEMIDEAVVNLAIGKGRLSLMLLRKLNVSAELC